MKIWDQHQVQLKYLQNNILNPYVSHHPIIHLFLIQLNFFLLISSLEHYLKIYKVASK